MGECTSTARACISISSCEILGSPSLGVSDCCGVLGALNVLLCAVPMMAERRPLKRVAAAIDKPRTKQAIKPNASGFSGLNHSDGGAAEYRP